MRSNFSRKESFYLGMEITNAPGEFIGDRNVPGGANTFSGSTSSSGNYECEIQDIMILSGHGGGGGGGLEPLTHGEQFAL